MEEVRSIKNSKTAENRTTHGRATGVHGRAPRAEEPESAPLPHGRPCASRTAVRGGTAVPAVRHGRAVHPPGAVSRFSLFLFGICFIFEGGLSSPLLNLLRAFFRLELGLGLE